MKKKIILFVLSFIMFIPGVDAAKQINEIEMKVSLDGDGVATVTETWNVKQQSLTFLEKEFKNIKDVEISDLKITSVNALEYKQVTDYKDEEATYSIINEKDKLSVKFHATNTDNLYQLTYKVNGMIVKYSDAISLNWYFLARTTKQQVNSLKLEIISPFKFNADNSVIYIIGNDGTSYHFENNHINVFVNNLQPKNQLRLLINFKDITFNKPIESKKKFNEALEEAKSENYVLEVIKEIFTSDIALYIGGGILAIIVVSIFIKIVKRTKKYNEYAGIKSFNNVTQIKLDNVNYFDTIPCNGDLYKISFIGGYYKIIKNRSDLIGAILLKWIFDGQTKVGFDRNIPYIKISENQYYDRTLDMDLYNILAESSNYNQIDSSKLVRYANSHYLRVMTWFNMGHNESINDEFSRGNIKRIKKLKRTDVILGENIYNSALEIAGLKKYLLNFNQVPRTSELTEDLYKYLLICAELFGIGEQVAKEILRKNPDNYFATQLLELEKTRYIYKNVYQTALTPYKEIVNTRNTKSSYDPELDNLLKQAGSNQDRNSKL